MWICKHRIHSLAEEMTKQCDPRIRKVPTVAKYLLGAREEQVAWERLSAQGSEQKFYTKTLWNKALYYIYKLELEHFLSLSIEITAPF